MTSKVGSDTTSLRDEMEDNLSRVRQLDPTIEEASVRRYAREMAEADAVLDSVDREDVPPVVAFSASWPEGTVR
jgi:hypothetical protein